VTAFARWTDVRLSGGPLRVYDSGPRDAPAVLLLHGAMLDTAPFTWRHLFPALARDRRVVAPDLPRHGGSRPWPGTLDQPALEAVVHELLDRLGIDRAALVGLSMGGGIAIGYALAHPERVAALVPINPGGLDGVRPLQFLTWLNLQSDPLLRWLTRMTAVPGILRGPTVRGLADRTADLPGLVRLAEAEARARVAHGERVLDDWQISAYGPWRMRLDFTPQLHRLAVPSLWLHGRDDRFVRGSVVRRAASLAPGARFAEVEDAGHFAPLEQPDRVQDLVEDFLTEVHGPGTAAKPLS
jgi:pimeloyl-ACP methyl ester carboxylesterase